MVDDKYLGLNDLRQNLRDLLQHDIDEIEVNIKYFQDTLTSFQTKALPTPDEMMAKHKQKELDRDSFKATESALRNKEPFVVDKEVTKTYAEELFELEERTKGVYSLIDMLSKRQKMANQVSSGFPLLLQITKELTPFKQFWEISYKFSQKRLAWWDNKLNTINCVVLQDNINAWFKSLNNIKNFSQIVNYPKPKLVLDYIWSEIETFKSFLPMVMRLRAKGLEKRHYVEMSRMIK